MSHLTFEARKAIADMLDGGGSLNEISRALKRPRSTVVREIRRNGMELDTGAKGRPANRCSPPGGLPPQPRLRRRGVHPRKMLPLREMQRRPPRLPRAEVRPSGGAALRVQRLPRPRRMRAADSTCAGSCRRAGAWTTSPRRK